MLDSLKRMASVFAVLCLLSSCAAVPMNQLDTSFLKEEPYRKQKQKVDLSSIQTVQDLAVVKAAINPIMRFIGGTFFIKLPAVVEKDLLTENGRAVLQRPPVQNQYNRFSSQQIGPWRICGKDTLSVRVRFSDLLGREFWTQDFLFINDGITWRFDDHREAVCER